MNSVNIVGRIANAVEVKTSTNGQVYSHFNVAVDEGKDKSGNKMTTFIPVTAFGKTAELLGQYAVKGSRLGIQGAIRTSTYTNKDGQKRNSFSVAANRIEFLDTKAEADALRAKNAASAPAAPAPAAPAPAPVSTPAPDYDPGAFDLDLDDSEIF